MLGIGTWENTDPEDCATAIETALEAQSADYTEWTGKFAEVEMEIEYEGCTVRTRMAMEGDYPMMTVESVER